MGMREASHAGWCGVKVRASDWVRIGLRDARYGVWCGMREIGKKYEVVGGIFGGRKFGLQKVVALFATLRKGAKLLRNTFVYKAKV